MELMSGRWVSNFQYFCRFKRLRVLFRNRKSPKLTVERDKMNMKLGLKSWIYLNADRVEVYKSKLTKLLLHWPVISDSWIGYYFPEGMVFFCCFPKRLVRSEVREEIKSRT